MKNQFFKIIKVVQETEVAYFTYPKILAPSDTVPFIRSKIGDNAFECVGCLYLSSKHQVIGWAILAEGSLTECPITPRAVATQALLCNAAAVILFHNHPSGDATPSATDLTITKQMKSALTLLSVVLLDHIIIGEQGKYTSLESY